MEVGTESSVRGSGKSYFVIVVEQSQGTHITDYKQENSTMGLRLFPQESVGKVSKWAKP